MPLKPRVACLAFYSPPRSPAARRRGRRRPRPTRTCRYRRRPRGRHGLNVDADVAMVYGITPSTRRRMQSWRDHGYTINTDDRRRLGRVPGLPVRPVRRQEPRGRGPDDQAPASGWGHGKDVYYMSPGPTYGAYLSTLVKQAIDDGAQAIYLEEPEFWVGRRVRAALQAGVAAALRRAVAGPGGLGRRPLPQQPSSNTSSTAGPWPTCSSSVREYGKTTLGRDVKCYVATHSLAELRQLGHRQPRVVAD